MCVYIIIKHETTHPLLHKCHAMMRHINHEIPCLTLFFSFDLLLCVPILSVCSISCEHVDERVVWVYLIQTLEGLHAMHNLRVLHRGTL
jgi:hypothetical protein